MRIKTNNDKYALKLCILTELVSKVISQAHNSQLASYIYISISILGSLKSMYRAEGSVSDHIRELLKLEGSDSRDIELYLCQ